MSMKFSSMLSFIDKYINEGRELNRILRVKILILFFFKILWLLFHIKLPTANIKNC